MYQLFQPIGGVRASVSPQTILKGRCDLPCRVLARSVTRYSPLSATAPRMMPLGVQLQAGRQSLGGELHRPLAGGGNAIEERMLRATGIDGGPVDFRRRARRRREQGGLFRLTYDGKGKKEKQQKRGRGFHREGFHFKSQRWL